MKKSIEGGEDSTDVGSLCAAGETEQTGMGMGLGGDRCGRGLCLVRDFRVDRELESGHVRAQFL